MIFIRWESITILPAVFWQFAAMAGVVGALGNGFLVMALQRGELSVLGPINAWKSVIGLAGGALLLREIPSAWSIAGILLIISGSYWVLDTTPERFSWRLFGRTDIRLRMAAMVLTAIEAVLHKQVIEVAGPLTAFAGWSWMGAFFTLVLILLFTPKSLSINSPGKQVVKRYFLLATSMGLMQLATNYTLQQMAVGPALALFQLSTLVSIFLGYKLFNETSLLRKILGGCLMVIGSSIIILWGSIS